MNAETRRKTPEPHSVRPYQHVLEPLAAYLLIAQRQSEDIRSGGCYNIGPDEESCLTTGELVTELCKQWERLSGDNVRWKHLGEEGSHEAKFLKLNCSKMKNKFGWKPVWNRKEMIARTAEWQWGYLNAADIGGLMENQIREYMADILWKAEGENEPDN